MARVARAASVVLLVSKSQALAPPELEAGADSSLFCSVGCMKTNAKGGIATALGMSTSASGDVSVAMGFNTTAGGSSSVAMGVSTRTVSDPNVPGGSSCGGCVSMGLSTTTIGDWSTAMGSGTTARGYASLALGEGTQANSFGEVALGLYTEGEPHRSEAELQNRSVIPIFDETDVVLRVGIGCIGDLAAGGYGCKETRRLDALRVYKSGALYLKKPNGEVIPDVQGAIQTCQSDLEETKQELSETKQELGALKDVVVALAARLAQLEGQAPVTV